MWRWIGATLLGFNALDATDSHPLHSSNEYERYTYEDKANEASHGVTFMQGTHYSDFQSRLQEKPLAPITRTMDGRFVVDRESSEEGGFTSPRRPIRGLIRKRPSYSPYYLPQMPFISRLLRSNQSSVNEIRDYQVLPIGVEGGVYHVRAGTTQTLQPGTTHPPPRLSFRYNGSGASPTRSRIFPLSPLLSHTSPEFGRHIIPDSPVKSAAIIGQTRVRSSSPTPYSDEWNQLAQLVSFSEMSSVRQPSSVERSFPSTVLSSFQNSAQKTPSAYGTPLNASSLQECAQSEYENIIKQQERMLQEHQLVMRRQQERDLQRRLPVMSQFRRLPDDATDSQEYQHHFIHPYTRDTGLVSQIPFSWATPRRPQLNGHRYSQFEAIPQVRYRGPRSHMFTPPYREDFGYQPTQDNLQHYVNLSPGRRNHYQQISGLDPYYLLKSPSSENQKPLATSSPPRQRVHPHPESRESIKVKPSTKTRVPEFHYKSKERHKKRSHSHELGDSDSSIDHPVAYTRDHLQHAIGRVRSGILRTSKRPHSAPNLSSSMRTESSIINSSVDSDKRIFVKVTKGRVTVPSSHDVSNEKSQEQSPDSSSGFGSKNTSQQQSSSQSGQSASALGLDSSRFDTSEAVDPTLEWEKEELEQPSLPPPLPLRPKVLLRPDSLHRQPPSYDQWLSRQVLPQFRFPSRHPALILGVPGGSSSPDQPSVQPYVNMAPTTPDQRNIYENVIVSQRQPVRVPKDITEPLTISTTPRVLNFGQTPLLDASVDDHYEFDTVLSPTPGGEESDIFWSRSRLHSGDRGLSDSEIYGSGGRQKETHESMEARVAAMKQEFQEYRQRQAKRRSSRELESVC